MDFYISAFQLELDTKPNMATLLIIPDYQLQRGCLVGAGAFGSVFKGVWNRTALSPTSPDPSIVKEATIEPKFVMATSSADDWLLGNLDSYANEEYLFTGDTDMEEETNKTKTMQLQNVESEHSPKYSDALLPPASVNAENSFVEGLQEGVEHDKMIVAIKVLSDATDANTCKALLEEARVCSFVSLFDNNLIAVQRTILYQ